MTNPNDSAYARPQFSQPHVSKQHWSYHPGSDGLSKRELFAAMAMQGLLANTSVDRIGYEAEAAGDAVDFADALIAALNQKQP